MSREKYLLFVLSPIEKDGDQFSINDLVQKKEVQSVSMCSLVYEGAIRLID